MKLVSAYKHPRAIEILFNLLLKRDPNENISHRAMPTLEEHKKFFYSVPYPHWCLIEVEILMRYIGAIYLTRADEIGIHLFPEHRERGHEKKAIQMLMLMVGHPRYFMNVGVNNNALAEIARELGFNHLQNTYEFNYDRP